MVINSEKISKFSRCAHRPALDAFLRDIGGKIARIPQCHALGTTLTIGYLKILVSIPIEKQLTEVCMALCDID